MPTPSRPRRPKGEGSISQRGDGRWEARVDLGRGPDGRRQRRTVYGATRAEALAKLRELLHQRAHGTLVITSRATVAEYLADWLATVVTPTKGPQTVANYTSCVRARLVPLLGAYSLGTLSRAQVQAAFARLASRYAPSSVRQTRAVLHAALTHAVDLDLLTANPVTRLKLPRVERRQDRYFTAPEAQRLLAAALREETAYGPLFALAITTGLRLGELLALRWEDVDDASGVLVVQRSIGATKGGRPIRGTKTEAGLRRLPLIRVHHAALAPLARRWGQPEGWLWPGPTGLPLRPETVRTAWYRFLARQGLPRRTPHAARHSVASLLISLGVPINVVAAILGHSRTSVTLDTYGHVLPGATREALEQLDTLLQRPPEIT